MSYGGWTPPPPPPEAYDHATAKAMDKAKRDQLKQGMASTGLLSDVRHEFVTIVVWVVTLPWRMVKGIANVATRPFRR
ncbi:MAG: hypothetical protein IH957_08670 [Chloroflexi bacterium]|nr:hypothetical protein [Chloroflexota bacterium]